jgi:hypothetical protein
VYFYNPSTWKLRQEDHEFEVFLDYIVRPCLNKTKQTKRWVSVAQTCNPSYLGGQEPEDCDFKASLGKKFLRFYLQNNQSEMDWRCGSSGRA